MEFKTLGGNPQTRKAEVQCHGVTVITVQLWGEPQVSRLSNGSINKVTVIIKYNNAYRTVNIAPGT